jgi:hypothetical protein
MGGSVKGKGERRKEGGMIEIKLVRTVEERGEGREIGRFRM